MPETKDVKNLSLLTRIRLIARDSDDIKLEPWKFHEMGERYREMYEKYDLVRALQTFCAFAMIV
ncbi:hypothetical protein EDC40_101130 [Aminobacter aminovorans]|uniref:Uncharacterized protein n=1 Tax=Aminobacter aminovorans TaxID=83263 RepID=A0A380WRA4_AMIAI|nr:hypothetical protein [Aminobacter aminovorans]TCS29815.1 hypothetical protein EDC40_101130 [Aminobacter aminovorans]SUU90664.1 Uncharacterised protein [Aminobacter aminovorans]